ncbi:MAG TPA: ATP-binding cassette domain-containing protein, partial [Candidatus Ozemobacteraceae bacterium]|nr:ATP-binding cassette domain-containing protein [Candidatus Ozemobacteraceae bacterium]
QRVEILKALISGCRILFLDEPTSVLTPPETRHLLEVLRRFAASGGAVIFITHKLEEVLSVASRLTVLRHGRVTGTLAASGTTPADLARLMIGRALSFDRIPRSRPIPENILLEVANLSVQDDRGRLRVSELSFNLREGEILGIAGVSGNGQRELVEALTGMRRPISGTARYHEADLVQLDARSIIDAGVAHIPEDRLRHGVAGTLSLLENAVLSSFHRPPFSRASFLQSPQIMESTNRIIDEFDVAVPQLESRRQTASTTAHSGRNLQASAKNLSGGNLQKFIVGRELGRQPSLIIASHPTYGVDVGAAETIHQRLLGCRDAGSSVLLVSEDLTELFRLSDRIAVMYGGRFAGIVPPDPTNLDLIGQLMTGSRPPESHP